MMAALKKKAKRKKETFLVISLLMVRFYGQFSHQQILKFFFDNRFRLRTYHSISLQFVTRNTVDYVRPVSKEEKITSQHRTILCYRDIHEAYPLPLNLSVTK